MGVGRIATWQDFEAQFNTFANIPLRVTPSREERKFNNAEFEWILCNRLRVQQPTAKDMTLQKCKCGINIEDGRHCRKGPINNGMMRDTCITTHYDAERRPNRFQGTPRSSRCQQYRPISGCIYQKLAYRHLQIYRSCH
jgi:hypothetical protein